MVKKRNDIDEKYKWDLTTIYKTEALFEQDYQKVNALLKEYKMYENNLMDSAENLLSCLELDEKIDRLINKLYNYAHLNNDVDTADTHAQTLYGEVKDLLNFVQIASSYIVPTLLTRDYSTIEKFYQEQPRLKNYSKKLEEIFKYKPYTLSKEEEKILSSLSNTFSDSQEIYSLLTNADMKFGLIHNELQEEVELTETNYGIYIKSKDRRVRKDAFIRLYEVYSSFKNTLSASLSSNTKTTVALTRIKGYKSSIQRSLYADDVNEDIYNQLIETVHNNLAVVSKYYSLKKDILKLEEFHLYDNRVEIIEGNNQKYSFDHAKSLVIEATKVLGNEYSTSLEKAFKDKWIDIYPNVGKRNGAYSSGSYDTNPFVLLNYQDRLYDVSIMAHELGHSIHSFFTRNNNPYQTGNYRIFVAEVASTVNELLLYKYIIQNTSDKQEKLIILNHMLELYESTLFRQTMFAEFEKIMYEEAEKGTILTNEALSNIYYDLNKVYFGNNVVVDDWIRYEWMRIPHFYYDFYVYKYATCLSCASHIVNNILNNKENAVEDYITFLKSGCKEKPLELLKKVGCDLTNPSVVQSAIDVFNDTLKQFVEIYNSKD